MTDLLDRPMSPKLEAAAIGKLDAEANLASLSALVMQLEIGVSHIKIADAEAELRITRAHASEAEHNAETARIATALNKRQEANALAGDHHHHVMHFLGGVDGKSVGGALSQLALWDRQDKACDMNIIINSGGGDAIAGLHLFDELSAYSIRGGGKHHLTMTVRGMAASMAGILLQAADERVVGPESYLMIHEISAGTGGKIGEIKDDYEYFKRMCDRIAKLFVKRSGGQITLAEFKEGWEAHNWWLDSDESLAKGFVDRIG